MVDLATIGAVLATAKVGVSYLNDTANLVKQFQGEDADTTQFKQLIADLSTQLMEARLNAMQVQTQLLEMQKDAEAEDEFKKKRDGYAVAKTTEGGLYLSLKAELRGGNLYEQICSVCADKDRLFMPLQKAGIFLKCANCGGEVRNEPRPQPTRPMNIPRGRRF